MYHNGLLVAFRVVIAQLLERLVFGKVEVVTSLASSIEGKYKEWVVRIISIGWLGWVGLLSFGKIVRCHFNTMHSRYLSNRAYAYSFCPGAKHS